MKSTSAAWLVLLAFLVSASAQETSPVQPTTAAKIAPGTIVSPSAGSGPTKLHEGTAPATPLPIPAGYVVVSTNHIDQVSAAAKLAIESSKDSAASLALLIQIFSVAFALFAAVCSFFGFKEFKDIKERGKELHKELQAVRSIKETLLPQVSRAVTRTHDMANLLIDQTFLRNVNQELTKMVKEKSPDLQRTALEALPQGRALFDRAKHYYETILLEAEGPPASSSHAQNQSVQGERVLSYVSAIMCVIAMRAESVNDAVMWARESVAHNPQKYEDRYFNLACALSKRNAPGDKKEALDILEQAFSRNAFSWASAWDEDDFDNIRDGLCCSEFAETALIQEGRRKRPGKAAVRRLSRKRPRPYKPTV